MPNNAIYWFRNDLRLSDLAGLHAAAQHETVLPVFIFNPKEGGDWAIGGAAQWWLHQSIERLSQDIAARGGQLILRRGEPQKVLAELVQQTGASVVCCSRQYQPWAYQLERDVHAQLERIGATLKRYPGTLLFEPGEVLTGSGQLFKVFTPFWRACLRQDPPAAPKAVPTVSWADSAGIESDPLEAWNLCPRNPNWAEGWDELWAPGEAGAHEALGQFLESRVPHYGDGRDIPGKRYTSRLSPHLRFGEISPRQVWHQAQLAKSHHPGDEGDVDKFLSEIGWREFCKHLVALFPEMPDKAFNPKFEHFPWAGDPAHLRAWQKGQTGYPIVDAGMRELWQTGFMHNRVRMVVASFLTKHLLTHWREGERWFWDCLLDADLASNACSWQWVGGSGADAAPYFRIFNPVAQGEKFDKDGDYTRHWVPELAELPNKYLHKPWEAPKLTLEAAGIKLGETYPEPIVDHKQAREAALAAYGTLKSVEID
jgi:deoxyribodipyrimidine photo-lyase